MLDVLEICTATASEMLEAAILTFHDINSGKPPISLQEIVHFINLSLSMAEVMKTRGLDVSFNPSEKDFQIWKGCLESEIDSNVFDNVVAGFWREDISSDNQPTEEGCAEVVTTPLPTQIFQESISTNSGPVVKECEDPTTIPWLNNMFVSEASFLLNSKEATTCSLFQDQDMSQGVYADSTPILTNSFTSVLNDASDHQSFDFSVFLDLENLDESTNSKPPDFEVSKVSSCETDELEILKGAMENDWIPDQGAPCTFPSPDFQDLDAGSVHSSTSPSWDLLLLIRQTAQFLQALQFLTCMPPSL